MLLLSNQALLTEVLWRLRNVRRLGEAISPPWEYACGASALSVFACLQERGYAREATVAESLAASSPLAQLKAVALEMGLKTSGSKQKLADAILAARPGFPCPPGSFVVLSSQGATLLEERMEQRAADERELRRLASCALGSGHLREALALVHDYKARHSVEFLMPANPLAVGVPDAHRLEDAGWILETSHEILDELDPESAERARVEAILSVFGLAHSAEHSRNPGGRFHSAVELSLTLELSARYVREVRAAQAEWGAGRVSVEFLSFPGDQGCPAGRKMARRKWPSIPIPPLPSPDCSRADGCSCAWTLHIDY